MKLLRWLEKVEEYAAFIFFIVAVLISLYGVFMRYVLNSPQFGLLEYVQILMPWAIFIGFGRALKENHHISVDIVYDLFPFSIKRVISIISNLCGVGYSLFLTVTGFKMVLVAKSNRFVSNVNAIPFWIEYIVLPVSMALLCLYFIYKTYKAIVGEKSEVIGENHAEEDSYLSDNDQGGMSV